MSGDPIPESLLWQVTAYMTARELADARLASGRLDRLAGGRSPRFWRHKLLGSADAPAPARRAAIRRIRAGAPGALAELARLMALDARDVAALLNGLFLSESAHLDAIIALMLKLKNGSLSADRNFQRLAHEKFVAPKFMSLLATRLPQVTARRMRALAELGWDPSESERLRLFRSFCALGMVSMAARMARRLAIRAKDVTSVSSGATIFTFRTWKTITAAGTATDTATDTGDPRAQHSLFALACERGDARAAIWMITNCGIERRDVWRNGFQMLSQACMIDSVALVKRMVERFGIVGDDLFSKTHGIGGKCAQAAGRLGNERVRNFLQRVP